MAKRRTRKQKETAKHQFKLSKERLDQIASSDGYVKSQIKSKAKTRKIRILKKEKPKDTAKLGESVSIKRGIARSVFLASLILSLELVIYFVLRQAR